MRINILIMNVRPSKAKSISPSSKYKYNFNSKQYDLTVNSPTFDSKIGATRAKQPGSSTLPEKIKSHGSFSLEHATKTNNSYLDRANGSTGKKNNLKGRDFLKLPQIQRMQNPELLEPKLESAPSTFYISKVYRAYKNHENTYMMNLARQHFMQTIEAIRIGKKIKLNPPAKQIKLAKKTPNMKTIFLDLDETLVHCDQTSSNCPLKLNFPIEGGGTISAGIRVRPFCQQFIKQLATFAEVIIFTASAPSYANVVLDYLDPNKKYFSHRLFRQHCTLEKGFYTKDLRIVNRRLEDMAIVDNSGFTFMIQPEFGIPILPFYHFAKDKELPSLLEYLRQLVKEPDMRVNIRQTFFWSQYQKGDADPRVIFQKHFDI